ncbi:MAG: MFS transporter [Deltaproteobacteria bacterium]|nr:MFS transporter [Deltaproteobacteria bacterium]
MTTMAKKYGHGSILAWFIWAIATGYFFWDYLQQVAPGAMGPYWLKAFHIDNATLGVIAGFYFYSYGIMQIPVGLIGDHFGPHRPLIAAACVAVAGNILLALASDPLSAEMARLMIGAGTAFSFVSCLKLISNWFPHRYFGTLVGLTSLIGMIGGISGEAPLSAAVGAFGWRMTIWILAAVGVGLALLIVFVVRDHPANATRWEDHPAKSRGGHKTLSDLKHVFLSGQTWMCGAYVSGMNAIYFVFGALWGADFFVQYYDITKVQAEGAMSMLFVGGIPGSFFFGWFSDKIGQRKMPMLGAGIIAVAVLSFVIYGPRMPLSVLYALLIVQGFMCSAYVVAFALGNDVRPPGSAGISVGFINTCSVASSAIFQPGVGTILDSLGGETSATVGEYQIALSTMVGLVVMALLVAVFSKETHCRPLYENGDTNSSDAQ